MENNLGDFINESDIPFMQDFLYEMFKKDTFYLKNDIILEFKNFLKSSPDLGPGSKYGTLPSSLRFLNRIQEMLIAEGRLYIIYRPREASSRIYSISEESMVLSDVDIEQFHEIKERLIRPEIPHNHSTMKINLSPFYDHDEPNINNPKKIGDGITHLNRYMSVHLSQNPGKWRQLIYDFLSSHELSGASLLVGKNIITSSVQLEKKLEFALDFLERTDSNEEMGAIRAKLHGYGFQDGWGNDRNRIYETMKLLRKIIEQPNERNLEEFLSRLPMMSRVVVISPHGWFGQANVLGRPDTGGQVVYILDQVKALEHHLAEDLALAGVNIEPQIIIITRLIPDNDGTTSNIKKEHVHDTKNSWIVRVPFRDESGNVVPHWISRFRIWPYLDQFAREIRHVICGEFAGEPDLIIGNYSDGNLVATLLAGSLDSVQCNIAHALEKSKYLFSDLYWDRFEEKYNFSVQFIADIISINLSNFIISSTVHEVIGTDSSIGQYESYQYFVMPGLLNVTSGVNLFHHRFNVIPPGVNERVYFSYKSDKKRLNRHALDMNDLLFNAEGEDILGELDNPDLAPIFTMSRLDRIKNITGLVECYGKSEKLREKSNLIIIASTLHSEKSVDSEEKEEIGRMYELIDKYDLQGSIRWLGLRLNATDIGEMYRVIADRKGLFVQPAIFEAFGLTVLEAMHTGLPVFATKFGGPMEIIEDGECGFLINPTDHMEMQEKLLDFIVKIEQSPAEWKRISTAAVKRAKSRFTWELYCNRLTRLTKVYKFWKYHNTVSGNDNNEKRTREYCDLLYNLFYKPRAANIKN